MDITIRNDSPEPPYKQIVSRIELMMVTGKLTADTQLPTLSELSESLGVSPETVKKAYSVLKGKGKVYAMQGVGYFVCGGERRRKKILMLIDRLDSYKVQIQRGLSDALGNGEELTILLHNQDVDAFISLLESTNGMYDCYVFNAPLMKTITMVAMFKDLRQVEELGCCNEDLANQYSWIDEEIQKRIV